MNPQAVQPSTVAIIALSILSMPASVAQAGTRYGDEVFPRVRITRDIAYGADLFLDLYQPEGDEEPLRPLMIWVHGGGFFRGDKTDDPVVKLSTHFARCGFVCASINYTLQLEGSDDWDSGDSVRQAADRATSDARSALCFLASQRERLRIDVGSVIVGGGSAGAFTALQLGCAAPSVCGTDIRGIVDFWGGLTDISLLARGSPPILVVHGTADRTVPYALAARLVARGKEVGVRVELHSLRGEGHAAWSRMEQYLAWIHEFIEDILP